MVSSETITVSGFDGLVGASATEPGASAELSVAGGAWAQSADIWAGQSLQVRVTTASDFVTPVEVSVSVGAASTTWTDTTRRPILTTCKAFLDGGYTTDGSYLLDPDGAGTGGDPFYVYCDQATDAGGWTLYSTGQHPGQGHDGYWMAGGYAGHSALVQQGDAYCETDWNTIQSSDWQGPLPIGQLTCGNPSYVTRFVAGGGGYCSPACPACWMLMGGSGMWQTAPCAYLGLVDRRWMR